MKNLTSIIVILSTTSALAAQVRLVNPSFDGAPILAYTPAETSEMANIRSHYVCRLHGHVRAAQQKFGSMNTLHKTKMVIRPGTKVLLPESLVVDDSSDLPLRDANTWSALFTYSSNNTVDISSKLTPSAVPAYMTLEKSHPCAQTAACRGFHIQEFSPFSGGLKEPEHPFLKSCYKWAISSKSDPLVFTEVICETDETVPWQRRLAQKVREFHQSTEDAFKVQGLPTADFGTELDKGSPVCAKYRAGTEASLEMAKFGTCGYARGNANFSEWMLSTGRLRMGPKRGPKCAREILNKYSAAVLPESYGVGESAANLQQAFCVDSVSKVVQQNLSHETRCSFRVETRDFLQAKNKLDISFNSEENHDEKVQARCEKLAECFQAPELSCAQANFCPAPGLIERRIK